MFIKTIVKEISGYFAGFDIRGETSMVPNNINNFGRISRISEVCYCFKTVFGEMIPNVLLKV